MKNIRIASRHQGFTLIELMITITIIGTLALIAYPVYTGYVRTTRLQSARSDVVQHAKVLEMFYSRCKSFTARPSSSGSECSQLPTITLSDKTKQFFNVTQETTSNAYVIKAKPIDGSGEVRYLELNSIDTSLLLCTPTNSGSATYTCEPY